MNFWFLWLSRKLYNIRDKPSKTTIHLVVKVGEKLNRRQKKKLFKQTLIKVRKLHPQKGDVICFQPNLDYVDLGTMCDFLKVYEDNKVFGEAELSIVPSDIRHIYGGKESAQVFVGKLQSIVDQMGE